MSDRRYKIVKNLYTIISLIFKKNMLLKSLRSDDPRESDDLFSGILYLEDTTLYSNA